jgi:hypothetical protein
LFVVKLVVQSVPLLLVVVVLLAGCGKPETTEVASDIRGTPINSPVATKQAVTKSNTAAVAKASAPQSAGGYAEVGFEKLSGYNIEVSDELLGPQTNKTVLSANDQIPAPIKELDSKKISLRGFMLPLKVEGGLVTELLIMKDQSMCCYGVTPRINEWVSVKMTNGGVKPVMDEPVTLLGTLRVGETRENGYLVGIYSLDGEKMAERN